MLAVATGANQAGPACPNLFSGPKDEYQDMTYIHMVTHDTAHIHTVTSFLPPSTNPTQWSCQVTYPGPCNALNHAQMGG